MIFYPIGKPDTIVPAEPGVRMTDQTCIQIAGGSIDIQSYSAANIKRLMIPYEMKHKPIHDVVNE